MIRMKWLGLCVAAAVGLWVGSVGWTQGTKDEKKAPNSQAPNKDSKVSDKAKAVDDRELASRLLQYGRDRKHAESLLLAAQILAKTPVTEMEARRTAEGAKEGTAAVAVDNSPKALVAEAKALSKSAHVAALVDATEEIIKNAPRGLNSTGAPLIDAFTIKPYETVNWKPVTFVANEKAVVYVDVGRYALMRLEVIDEFGNVIASDSVPGSYYTVSWFPARTGSFRFRLMNYDGASYNCVMVTN